MSKQRYEYKVAFVDFRGRISIEGEEMLIEEGERMTAFGRRYLNALGEQGWELVGVQPQPAGGAFHIFKRPLAEGEQAEPARPIERPEPRRNAPPYPPEPPFPPPNPFAEAWEGPPLRPHPPEPPFPPPMRPPRPPQGHPAHALRRPPDGGEGWDAPAD